MDVVSNFSLLSFVMFSSLSCIYSRLANILRRINPKIPTVVTGVSVSPRHKKQHRFVLCSSGLNNFFMED